MKTIGTEEHFVTDDVVTAWSRVEGNDSRSSVPPGEMGERLREVGERRIGAMDEAGLDVQVISLTSPGLHNLSLDDASRLQVETNDRIAELVNTHSDRFQGFATLATPAPDDYPYRPGPDGGVENFLRTAGLDPTDQERIASGNWKALVAGIRR